MIHRFLILFFLFGPGSHVFSQSIVKKRIKTSVSHSGISRIRGYNVFHPDIPPAFDDLRILFISDFHYKSKFKEKHLASLTRLMKDLHPDLILMGGDYKGQCELMGELFDSIASVEPPCGIAGVLGNHDYTICYDSILKAAKDRNIRLLEHEILSVKRDTSEIFVAGVRNPFDLEANVISPAQELDSAAYVILLTHTPDYVADVDNSKVDLALSGHTHGGQVTVFGWFAPRTNSHYGQRFRTGLKKTDQQVPVLITNGLGTSRKKWRFFAPSEVIILDLHAKLK